MGIRRSHLQVDLYKEVLEFSKGIFPCSPLFHRPLEKFTELDSILANQKYIYGEEIGAVDAIYFSILSHVYMLCMLPEYQQMYPHVYLSVLRRFMESS